MVRIVAHMYTETDAEPAAEPAEAYHTSDLMDSECIVAFFQLLCEFREKLKLIL